jgi:hypothetical protein
LSNKQKAEFIFIEDSAKVYKGKARLPRLNCKICKFDWLPSFNLNLIEKIWQ